MENPIIQNGESQAGSPDSQSGQDIMGIGLLINRSIDLYKLVIFKFFIMFLLQMLFVFVPIGIVAIFVVGSGVTGSNLLKTIIESKPLLFVLILPIYLFVLVLIFIFTGIYYGIVRSAFFGEETSLKESYKNAKSLLLPLALTLMLSYLIAALGYLALIIPGLIFTVNFSLAGWVVVLEGCDGISALKRSKELIQGYWFKILWRFAVLIIVQIIFNLIPFINFFSFLLMPFWFIITLITYNELKGIKGESKLVLGKSSVGTKAFVLILFLLIVVIFIFLSTSRIPRSASKLDDVKRHSSALMIQMDLELYFNENNEYPGTLDELGESKLVNFSKPEYPATKSKACKEFTDYKYAVDSTKMSYTLTYCQDGEGAGYKQGINAVSIGGTNGINLIPEDQKAKTQEVLEKHESETKSKSCDSMKLNDVKYLTVLLDAFYFANNSYPDTLDQLRKLGIQGIPLYLDGDQYTACENLYYNYKKINDKQCSLEYHLSTDFDDVINEGRGNGRNKGSNTYTMDGDGTNYFVGLNKQVDEIIMPDGRKECRKIRGDITSQNDCREILKDKLEIALFQYYIIKGVYPKYLESGTPLTINNHILIDGFPDFSNLESKNCPKGTVYGYTGYDSRYDISCCYDWVDSCKSNQDDNPYFDFEKKYKQKMEYEEAEKRQKERESQMEDRQNRDVQKDLPYQSLQ